MSSRSRKRPRSDDRKELKDNIVRAIADCDDVDRLVDRLKIETNDVEEVIMKRGPPPAPDVTCSCGNSVQHKFIERKQEGTIVCTECGNVVINHSVYDGDWTRHFEDDGEDKRTYGGTHNLLFSQRRNLRTTMQGTQNDKTLRHLRSTNETVQMNFSQLMKDERKTREGYKDKKKAQAFEIIDRISSQFFLHARVVDLAKSHFAMLRDKVEAMRDFRKYVAASVVLALEEVEAKAQDIRSTSIVTSKEWTCLECGVSFSIERDFLYHSCQKQQLSPTPSDPAVVATLEILFAGEEPTEGVCLPSVSVIRMPPPISRAPAQRQAVPRPKM